MDEASAMSNPIFQMRKPPAQWQTLMQSQGGPGVGWLGLWEVLLATWPALGHLSCSPPRPFELGNNTETPSSGSSCRQLSRRHLHRHLVLKMVSLGSLSSLRHHPAFRTAPVTLANLFFHLLQGPSMHLPATSPTTHSLALPLPWPCPRQWHHHTSSILTSSIQGPDSGLLPWVLAPVGPPTHHPVSPFSLPSFPGQDQARGNHPPSGIIFQLSSSL